MTSTPITTNYPEHPDDVTAAGGTRVIRNYYACQSHCCKNHGCKYSYRGCPVTTGLVTQDHPCEQCTDDLYEHAFFTDSPGPQPGEVGYLITLGLKRENAANGQMMADMPTPAQIHPLVTEALAGLTINGWALTRVTSAHDTDPAHDDDRPA